MPARLSLNLRPCGPKEQLQDDDLPAQQFLRAEDAINVRADFHQNTCKTCVMISLPS